MRALALLAAGLTALLGLTACGGAAGAGDDQGRVRAVAMPYAYGWLLQRLGGDDVEVRDLTPAGSEAHDVELSPKQVAAVLDADLVVRSPGFSPALDDAVEQADAVDVDVLSLVEVHEEEGGHDEHGNGDHDHAGEDPHVWLDPVRLATIAAGVADALVEVAPQLADGVRARQAELTADLADLDADYRTGLATCERRDVVTSHEAFGYLTERYGLRQVGVAGLSPDVEPSARRLAQVADLARERGVTTVFFEETVSPRVAEQVAREAGATVAVLSPLETAPETGDYLTAMRDDLAALRLALGCS